MNPIMLTTGEIRFDTFFLEKSVGNSVEQLTTVPGGAAERQRRDPASRVSAEVANINDGDGLGRLFRRKRLFFGT